ncbi:GFA family protein [Stappia sp. MMSF_3263]|uniref:GFA family protein n=1 Tax=Stappia sp. MMSF_3263 TaxID=3046693 RepID=UPI00273E577B|nr:GFA family protein [Stappia sp. MMSF_3263]
MQETSTRLEGACRCGRTAIEIAAPPFMTAACHCRGCQKMSSSAYSLTAMVPAAAFRVTRGEPVKGGLKGPDLDHFFCPDCMTWMFTRITQMPDIVNVRPTMFDNPKWCHPFIETMTAEKLDWVELPVARSYEGFPPPEDFGPLMQDFAAQS